MLILFKMIESIDMTLCVISFLVTIKNQMHGLQKSVDDREDETEHQISVLKNTIDDRQEGLENQIIDLQEEISELKYLIGQLESQINEMGQNKGNIFCSGLLDKATCLMCLDP